MNSSSATFKFPHAILYPMNGVAMIRVYVRIFGTVHIEGSKNGFASCVDSFSVGSFFVVVWGCGWVVGFLSCVDVFAEFHRRCCNDGVIECLGNHLVGCRNERATKLVLLNEWRNIEL